MTSPIRGYSPSGRLDLICGHRNGLYLIFSQSLTRPSLPDQEKILWFLPGIKVFQVFHRYSSSLSWVSWPKELTFLLVPMYHSCAHSYLRSGLGISAYALPHPHLPSGVTLGNRGASLGLPAWITEQNFQKHFMCFEMCLLWILNLYIPF